MKHHNLGVGFLIFSFIFISCGASRVLELTDKFSEIRREGGYWLVKFYAPWCGHCKRLEPVWAHVAQALHKTNIRVGKVDCTRFPSVSTEFSISGFPTIKFIKPDEDYTFHGDRSKEEIINFALRLAGPPVQEVSRSESLTNLKNTNQIFFMFVGPQEGDIWDAFLHIANKMQPHGFFFRSEPEIVREHFEIEDFPKVLVYKEGVHYVFPEESTTDEHVNSSLHRWVNEERFETFPKITRGNINELLQTRKYIVLVVIEENKLQQIPQEMLEFRNMVENVVRRKREKFHKYFQFGWVGNPEIANSIAMQVLPLPYLLVLNSTTNHHHMFEEDVTQLTEQHLDAFLEKICNQTVPAYGGNGFAVRIYRMYFETRTALADMWRGNPVLTTVLFGLPLGFLSLILYSICCADILDADDEEEEELLHEKKE